VIKSSGNSVFDRFAESAVYKAAPLPQLIDPKAVVALCDF
jgi:colicin import membrane protein